MALERLPRRTTTRRRRHSRIWPPRRTLRREADSELEADLRLHREQRTTLDDIVIPLDGRPMERVARGIDAAFALPIWNWASCCSRSGAVL